MDVCGWFCLCRRPDRSAPGSHDSAQSGTTSARPSRRRRSSCSFSAPDYRTERQRWWQVSAAGANRAANSDTHICRRRSNQIHQLSMSDTLHAYRLTWPPGLLRGAPPDAVEDSRTSRLPGRGSRRATAWAAPLGGRGVRACLLMFERSAAGMLHHTDHCFVYRASFQAVLQPCIESDRVLLPKPVHHGDPFRHDGGESACRREPPRVPPERTLCGNAQALTAGLPEA